LKSPITLTRSAFGAHTPKCTPVVRPTVMRCAPSFSKIRLWVPSPNRWRFEIGEHAAVAVGVVDLGRVIGERDLQAVVRNGTVRLLVEAGLEHAGVGRSRHRDPRAGRFQEDLDRARGRLKNRTMKPPPDGSGCGPSSANGSHWRPEVRAASAPSSAEATANYCRSIVTDLMTTGVTACSPAW
jgi:hypothetical protein